MVKNDEINDNLKTNPITIVGVVVHGRKEGRKIGFPTANIQPELTKLLNQNQLKHIPTGIYASKIKVKNNWYLCATSYGNAPTYNFWETTLESHILDFDMDIYDQTVELQLTQYLRPIAKFEGIAKLIEQIKIDCQVVRDLN